MISSSKEEREKAEKEEEDDEETLEMLRERRMAEMRRATQGRIVQLPGKVCYVGVREQEDIASHLFVSVSLV